MIDKELQDYYENRFSMMATKGWSDLVEDVTKMKEVVDNLRMCSTQSDLDYRKGQLDIIDWLLGLKSMSEQAFQELTSEGDPYADV